MGIIYKPGLEGVIAAISSISDIEPERGDLSYRGYDINVLAKQSCYEEVAFLLLYCRLPEPDEFEIFCNDLSKNREIPKELIEALRPSAFGAHPMDMLRTSVAFLGMVDPEARDLSRETLFRKSIRTIAKLPTVIAANYRLSQGHEPISPMR